MTKVVLDAQLREKLNGLDKQLEVCDETGRTVGHFLPTEIYHEMLSRWAESAFSPEDLELAREQTGGRTLAEIWQRLGRK